MKKIGILGSTGSIGTQSLQVIRGNSDKFQVTALGCGKNIELLKAQILEFQPEMVAVEREADVKLIKADFPKLKVFWGDEGLINIAKSECNMVLNGLMGMKGLSPTMAAIEAGKDIALANKETLVAGGSLVMEKAREKGVKILPIDSEHSAIFQCLEGNQNRKIKRILLTCSGGPFRNFTKDELEKVTLQDALKHPKWNMGKKITIDSATLMNKGLEVIEAKWLFDVEPKDIEVLVHPQSIVHSAVEYEDNSVIAQLGIPDMQIPISLALGYPNRIKNNDAPLDFFNMGKELTFEKPDMDTFRCLKIAYEAINEGGSYPLVMNGANEVLVDLFLKEKIEFKDISLLIDKVLEKHKVHYNLDMDSILEIDRETREYTEKLALGQV